MEPKSPTPHFEVPSPGVRYERGAESAPQPPTPEQGQFVERGGERLEQRSDAVLAAPATMPVLPPPLPVPATDSAASASTSTTPAIAGDEDLIEKEWVDRAKQIIESTKDDPFRREQEVNKLQAEYLRKRYGREFGNAQR